MKKTIVYYTDNRLDKRIDKLVKDQLKRIGLPIVSVSLKPIDFGILNICLSYERGITTMFRQILAGLEVSQGDTIFFCEHDVLYHPSHFDLELEDRSKIYYNTNLWAFFYDIPHWRKWRSIKSWNPNGDKCLHHFGQRTSQLCADREVLLRHYRKRVELVEKNKYSRQMGFEPGTHKRKGRVDDLDAIRWQSKYPNIDIKHHCNLTAVRWKKEQFRNDSFKRDWQETTIDRLKGWENLKSLLIV